MKINSPHFGSKALYKAKLEQTSRFLPFIIRRGVYISELEQKDGQRMENLIPQWEKTKHGKPIIKNFLHELESGLNRRDKRLKKFYIIEYPSIISSGKVKAMAIAEMMEEFVQLSMLQSCNEKKEQDLLKGAGSCLLYAVSKLAESLNANSVYIRALPEAVGFYKKTGAESVGIRGVDFVIKKENFGDFHKKLEDKYSIKKIN